MTMQATPDHAATSSTIRNGIDVSALSATIDAITQQPALGRTAWSISSRWAGGTRSDHQVRGCTIGGRFIPRPFTIRIDEPHELCGSNQFANPQEYLLAAMNACMMVGYAAVGALMGITLTSLEVETTGEIDLRGFLGIDATVPNGYPKLEQTVRIAGNGSPEQFQTLHATVQATSPNYFNITRAVPVNSRLVIA